jgi:hypothetical protein
VVSYRITGDRSQRKSGADRKFLHVYVDGPTLLTPNYWPRRRPATSNWFLIRAAGWVGRHGMTINLVMTDNGSGYRPYLSLTACHRLADHWVGQHG